MKRIKTYLQHLIQKLSSKYLVICIVICMLIGALFVPIILYARNHNGKAPTVKIGEETSSQTNNGSTVAESSEAKKEVAKNPPKRAEPKITTKSTAINSDGSSTTTVSEGDVKPEEVEKISQLNPGGDSPQNLRFSDETGNNSALAPLLRSYLQSNLRWSGEIPYLYQVTIRDAGDVGWEGQYAGSYKKDRDGKIISAFGYIILNTYYHQSDPSFNAYMELVFSHEYGHHYSLYHKWISLNLSNESRFPDSYYTVRPLSKANTATDYSLGWQNCESEIVAEDYSYLYSGFRYHAMADLYGYPSAGTKTWFDSLSTNFDENVSTSDNPPSVEILSPANNSTQSGKFTFQVDAVDDKGIARVDFFINKTFITSDQTAPYSVEIVTDQLGEGAHTLRAIAYDTSGASAQAQISVNFNNLDLEKPTVNITSPLSNPYSWFNKTDLVIALKAHDNVSIVKMNLYIDGVLKKEVKDVSELSVTWPVETTAPGSYLFRAEAFDGAGNMGFTELNVIKTNP